LSQKVNTTNDPKEVFELVKKKPSNQLTQPFPRSDTGVVREIHGDFTIPKGQVAGSSIAELPEIVFLDVFSIFYMPCKSNTGKNY